MEIIKHRNGTVTLKGVTPSDLSDLEASLYGRGIDFSQSSRSPKPADSSYASWSAEDWASINRNISERHFELAAMLQNTINELRKR